MTRLLAVSDSQFGGLLGAPVVFDAHALHDGPPVDSLRAHGERFGARPDATGPRAADLIAHLEDIELTGHGGGHFPAAAKWRAVRAARRAGLHRSAVVVGNGAEGEPLSAKDAALMTVRPHLVLDGLAIASEAVHATEAILWLHEDAADAYDSLRAAVAERRAAGHPDPAVRFAFGPARYLSGESSAVVRALSGGPALPAFRREPTAAAGIDGRPTLVHNVETLARVALAARDRRDGTSTATATRLLTVALPPHRVVLELPADAPLGTAVRAVSGAQPLQAVLLGGYGGQWRSWTTVEHVPLGQLGAALGAGVVLPLAAHDCGIARTAEIARYLADSSARQCGPCLFGLAAIADTVDDLADVSARRRDMTRLHRFLAEVDGRGACHHPDGAVRMIASALHTFADDVAAHLHGRCLHARVRRTRFGRRG